MQKTDFLTRDVGNILTEIIRRNDLEPKMLEQKVFDLWREHLGVPFSTKTMPVSLSDGVLKIYTEYPPYRTELLLHKEKIIADLNAALDKPILTDFRIEVRPVHAASPPDDAKRPHSQHKPSEPSMTDTDPCHHTNPAELEQIEQILASVTDERLKKSLRQLFKTQSEDKP